MDRGAWRATVHRVARSRTQLKQLGTHAVEQRVSMLSTMSTLVLNQVWKQSHMTESLALDTHTQSHTYPPPNTHPRASEKREE